MQGRLAAVFDFTLTDLYFLNITQYPENSNSGEAFRMCYIMLAYTMFARLTNVQKIIDDCWNV
jgi:hypothetical protein